MPTTNWITAGLLMRGQLRREMAKAGITYTETRGLLESVFVIPDNAEYLLVHTSLKRQGII
jgi:hypothetical protein